MLDGNSEIDAWMGKDICYLICLRHLTRWKAVTNQISPPYLFPFCVRNMIWVTISNISTLDPHQITTYGWRRREGTKTAHLTVIKPRKALKETRSPVIFKGILFKIYLDNSYLKFCCCLSTRKKYIFEFSFTQILLKTLWNLSTFSHFYMFMAYDKQGRPGCSG